MDEDGVDEAVRLAVLFGSRPGFESACFKNCNERDGVPTAATAVSGGPYTVCLHTERRSMLVEYMLDRTVFKPGVVDSVGSKHDAYTPFRDEL